MKTLGVIAILAVLWTTGCDYHGRYRHRDEIRRTREDLRRAGWEAREELRRARQDVQRELRQAREQFRREMREAHRDLRHEFDRW
jgi:outer membrane lipopolysaccharide assembly protein LptE/RlpB